ncbi:photosynthetic NDH subunit of lumenal location 2, chloroplastic [Macadamia integrifolia]|uniref:photosynthetic NDH subunit of lumenal location 2, chloroplastic n=1 Tax=Macadamia integrifolia TaxID=60698 RepID=UPI001C5002A0|nr:photosynthetic NDH subunit of lumenal location 2, chloroplastic [Macadamia integrifolia]
MGSLAKPNSTTLCHPHHITAPQKGNRSHSIPAIRASSSSPSSGEGNKGSRRQMVSAFLGTTAALAVQSTPMAVAQNWGTRSFLLERFFQPGLSPEDAVARIRQTAEGLHSLREMVERMSWRYVIFYIRLKSAYLSQDVKNALSTLPEYRKKSYIKTANELVDNMAELDYYVRSPKVYESYLYYEKTLKSIDELVALLV